VARRGAGYSRQVSRLSAHNLITPVNKNRSMFAGFGQLTFDRFDLEGKLLSVIGRIAEFHHGHLIGSIGPNCESGIRRVVPKAFVSALRPAIDKGLQGHGIGHTARTVGEHNDMRRNLRQGYGRSIERQSICRGNEKPSCILSLREMVSAISAIAEEANTINQEGRRQKASTCWYSPRFRDGTVHARSLSMSTGFIVMLVVDLVAAASDGRLFEVGVIAAY
jgi:hypothetical protein